MAVIGVERIAVGLALDAHLRGAPCHHLDIGVRCDHGSAKHIECPAHLVGRVQAGSCLGRLVSRHIDKPLFTGRVGRAVLMISCGERPDQTRRIPVYREPVGRDAVVPEDVEITLSGSGVVIAGSNVRARRGKGENAQFQHLRARLSKRVEIEIGVARFDKNQRHIECCKPLPGDRRGEQQVRHVLPSLLILPPGHAGPRAGAGICRNARYRLPLALDQGAGLRTQHRDEL